MNCLPLPGENDGITVLQSTCIDTDVYTDDDIAEIMCGPVLQSSTVLQAFRKCRAFTASYRLSLYQVEVLL